MTCQEGGENLVQHHHIITIHIILQQYTVFVVTIWWNLKYSTCSISQRNFAWNQAEESGIEVHIPFSQECSAKFCENLNADSILHIFSFHIYMCFMSPVPFSLMSFSFLWRERGRVQRFGYHDFHVSMHCPTFFFSYQPLFTMIASHLHRILLCSASPAFPRSIRTTLHDSRLSQDLNLLRPFSSQND